MKSKRLILSVVVALAGFLPQSKASISLGTAGSFAVLGSSTVTSTGPTVLTGDLGVYSGTSITGFPPGTVVNGTTYAGDAVAQGAQADALTAYNTLAGQTVSKNGTLTGDILGTGGTVPTLTPGVYSFGTSSAQLTGTLTLNGAGIYVFQIGSTLTTASASSIVLENGAQAADVYWQVGSSATLGTTTSFDGSIVALTSITLNTGATLGTAGVSLSGGRALALTGAVTLDSNDITVPTAVPEPGTLISGALLLLPFGASTLADSAQAASGLTIKAPGVSPLFELIQAGHKTGLNHFMISTRISLDCQSCPAIPSEYRLPRHPGVNCKNCLMGIARDESNRNMRCVSILGLLAPFGILFWVGLIVLTVRLLRSN